MEKAQKRPGREILIGYAVMALMIVVGELSNRGCCLQPRRCGLAGVLQAQILIRTKRLSIRTCW